MILFRGTWGSERKPRPRQFECVFFSPTFEYAAGYAAGEMSGHDRGRGYVQRYRLPEQRLLDRHTKEAWDLGLEYNAPHPMDEQLHLDLFWDPPKSWMKFLAERGFTGTLTGPDICIFDPSGAVLTDQWRVEWLGWNGKRDVFRRKKVA